MVSLKEIYGRSRQLTLSASLNCSIESSAFLLNPESFSHFSKKGSRDGAKFLTGSYSRDSVFTFGESMFMS